MSYEDLQKAEAEGPKAIARKAWSTEENGRQIACLLATISPEAGRKKDAGACPIALMRPWLAHLTVWLDDCGSDEAWWPRIQRYAAVIERVSKLDDAADRRLQYAIRALSVREAMRHTKNVRN